MRRKRMNYQKKNYVPGILIIISANNLPMICIPCNCVWCWEHWILCWFWEKLVLTVLIVVPCGWFSCVPLLGEWHGNGWQCKELYCKCSPLQRYFPANFPAVCSHSCERIVPQISPQFIYKEFIAAQVPVHLALWMNFCVGVWCGIQCW